MFNQVKQGTLFNLAILFSVTFITSCADTIEDRDVSRNEKIIGGSAESGHPYVVSLVGNGGTSECTGTVIAPRVVLTAAHCIISDYGLHPPVLVEVGATVGAPNNARLSVNSYLIREGWEMRTGGFDYNFDIALLFLDRDAPVSSATYSRQNPSDVINQSILAVGYGNNNGFQGTGGGIKRSVNLTITESHQFHFIATWRNGVPLDTCQGDSGGPALLLGARGMEVLGVVSNGPTFCQGSTQYTSVGPHAFWIDQNIGGTTEATENPWAASNPSANQQGTTYTSCSALNQCIEGCQERSSDQSVLGECLYECEIASSATAINHYLELLQCTEQFGCQGNPNCQSAYCADQMRVCGFEVSAPTQNANSDLPPINSCVELNECDRQCGQSSVDRDSYNACAMVCYSRADSESIGQLNQLQSCMNRLSPTCVDAACQERECGAEITACGYQLSTSQGATGNGNTGSNGGGSESCSEIYSCMATCGGDDACIQTCAGRGSETAISQINDLVDCYYGNSCGSFFDYRCMSDECPSEFSACIN